MIDFMIALAAVVFLFAFGWLWGCIMTLDAFRAQTPDLYEEWKRRRAERKGRQ